MKNNLKVCDIFEDYSNFNPYSKVNYIDSRNLIVEQFASYYSPSGTIFKFELNSINRRTSSLVEFTQNIQIIIFLYNVEQNEKVIESFEVKLLIINN